MNIDVMDKLIEHISYLVSAMEKALPIGIMVSSIDVLEFMLIMVAIKNKIHRSKLGKQATQ